MAIEIESKKEERIGRHSDMYKTRCLHNTQSIHLKAKLQFAGNVGICVTAVNGKITHHLDN